MALGGIIPVILFSMAMIKADITRHIVTAHFKAVLGDCTDNIKYTDYQTFHVRSQIHCLTKCSQADSCKSVIFQRQNKACLLLKNKTACVASSGLPKSIFVITEKIERDAIVELTTQTPLATAPVTEVMIAETTSVSSTTPVPEMMITETTAVSSSVSQGTIDSAEYPYYGNSYDLGVKTIQPILSKPPFEVWCDSWYGTIILRNTQQNSSFLDKDLQDFKEGFGNVNGDHMQSLDNIHDLTSSDSYDLVLVLHSISGSYNWSIRYKNVQIADSTFHYKITFDSVQSYFNPNNQLTLINDTMFTARNSDHDENHDVNCAVLNNNGFWYNSDCNGCNVGSLSFCFLKNMPIVLMALSPSWWSNTFREDTTNGYGNNQNFANNW